MQPKFTPQKSGIFCTKIFALALIFAVSTQISYSQQIPTTDLNQPTTAEKVQKGLKNVEQAKNPLSGSITSVGFAPIEAMAKTINRSNPGLNNIEVNPFSRAFCYQTPAAGTMQLNKQSTLNTTVTPIGGATPAAFPGATAWRTTTNQLYEVDQGAPFGLYTVDTVTNARTLIANCTGMPQAILSGMTWDPSTNTMYGVSTSLAVSQIFTINIVTGVCTPIGAASAVAPGAIMLNAAPGGSLFSVDIVTDNLYRWNKTTGVPTLVGSLGVNANFGQDGHFDPDGTYYWASALAAAPNQLTLRIIDTLTGSSTIVGAYTTQTATFAIYSPPLPPCTGTPAPGNTIATPNPVGPGNPLTLTIQNIVPFSSFVNYWQSSPTGAAPWTTIGSGPGNSFVTSQLVPTWYRDSVVCTPSSQFGISTPVLVNMACAWTAGTAYPIPAYDNFANVLLNGNVYSFGGASNNAPVANAYRYNGTTWTALAPLPAAKQGASAATDGTNIYIVGGVTGGVPTTTFYRYNVALNTYTTLASPTVGTWNQNCVYLNGIIYKFCGTGPATNSTNVLEIYNIATNTWTLGANYPLNASFVAASASGSSIIAAGGVTVAGAVTALVKAYRYDPALNLWNDAAVADLPADRWGMAFAQYGPYAGYGSLALAGGVINGSTTITNTAINYDPITNSWTNLPNQLIATYRGGGAGLAGNFHAIAGSPFVGVTNNQRLGCPYPACTGTPAPGATIGPSFVCIGTPFTLSLQSVPSVLGLTFQWQSSPDNVTYTDIPGATNGTYSSTFTTTTWYRCRVTCSGNTGTSTPLSVGNGQGVFTSQPANVSIQCGNNATFSYTATGLTLSYSWEYRTSPAGFWQNVTGAPISGAAVSGQNTSSLTLTNVSQALNGYQFRGLIQGPCTAVDFTNVATLTVTPVIPLVTVTPPSPICLNTIVQLSLTNVLTPVSTVLFNEDFATVSPLPAGWASVQRSNPLGPTGWFQGVPGIFPSQNGAPSAYIAANFNNTGAVGTISNWLFTPNVTTIKNGDVFTFYTRKIAPDAFPDRLQVRMSLNGASTNVGADENSVGDFTTLLLDINPTLISGVYPIAWTQYTITISGVPVPTSGRLAFRYFVTNAGSAAPNSDFIGIDNVVYTDIIGGLAAGIWTASPAAPNSMFTDAGATLAYTGTPASTIYVRPLVNTNYSVFFTTPTPCTSATIVVPVNVTNPITGLTTPADRIACVGTNTSFSVSPGGGPLTFQWQVSVNSGLTWSNIVGATSATLNLTNVTQLMNNNLYRVTVTAAPCGSSTTLPGKLTVNQLPVVTISATSLQLVPGATSTISGTSTPAPHATLANWVWTLNGNTIAGATGSSVTANVDQTGAYQASVTDVNGCRNSSNTVTIGWAASDKLWIIPNPNNGQFDIRLYYSGTQAETRKVQIYSAGGQLMAQQEYNFDSNTPSYARLTFDLPQLAAGSYAVKVVDKNGKKITSGIMIIL